MAKKSQKTAEKSQKTAEELLRLFYIFYNRERWDNWLKTLSESRFEADPKSEEMPEGFRVLDSFSVDITIEVLKIIRLFQNRRFSKEESLDRLAQVEAIVMSAAPKGPLSEIIGILQFPKLVLFAGCRKYLQGRFDKDIKANVKKGRDLLEKDNEAALEAAAHIAASVLDGASCCGKYVKDDIECPTLFDEWLFECERMSEALVSLKNFDETTGEED